MSSKLIKAGSGYKNRLRAACNELGAYRPLHAQTNGWAERFAQTSFRIAFG